MIDVETGGFNAKKDALLEVAAVTLKMDDNGMLDIDEQMTKHILPFEGSNMDPKSMEINGIDPWHPFRFAVSEHDGLSEIFRMIRASMKKNACKRAIMVGHNTVMDLNFVNAAAERCKLSRNPFHPFSIFDTVSLAGLAYGQTVLAINQPLTACPHLRPARLAEPMMIGERTSFRMRMSMEAGSAGDDNTLRFDDRIIPIH